MTPVELQVWSSDQCAAYLGLARAYFMKTTRFSEGFPQPLKNFEGKHPRWAARAVISWALQE